MKRNINTIFGEKCCIVCETEKGFITVSFPDAKTEYTISPIKNSEYMVMIQTEGASEGPMTSVSWCDPGDTWLSESCLSIYNAIYNDEEIDNNTVFLATLMYTELLNLNKNLKIAKAAVEFGKALGV